MATGKFPHEPGAGDELPIPTDRTSRRFPYPVERWSARKNAAAQRKSAGTRGLNSAGVGRAREDFHDAREADAEHEIADSTGAKQFRENPLHQDDTQSSGSSSANHILVKHETTGTCYNRMRLQHRLANQNLWYATSGFASKTFQRMERRRPDCGLLNRCALPFLKSWHSQLRAANEIANASRKRVPHVCRVWRGIHAARSVVEHARPHHDSHAAKPWLQRQQTAVFPELLVQDLVSRARNAGKVNVPWLATQHHVRSNRGRDLNLCGELDRFLQKSHFALPGQSKA